MDKSKFDIPPVKASSDPLIAEMQKRWRTTLRCADCFHAYVTPSGFGLPDRLACMHSPPNHQLVMVGANEAVRMIPRLVEPNFFCHQYSDKETINHGPK